MRSLCFGGEGPFLPADEAQRVHSPRDPCAISSRARRSFLVDGGHAKVGLDLRFLSCPQAGRSGCPEFIIPWSPFSVPDNRTNRSSVGVSLTRLGPRFHEDFVAKLTRRY